MPIRTGAAAPYAPPATVLQVVTALRDRGLTTPITSDVLLRAGVVESLIPRVLRSLTGLELIDEDGRLTPAMEALRRAPSTDFKARLEEHVRAVYAEVFQFTDPAKDDPKRIADAFRVYEPIGQRQRMVTLFLGLCEAAGIIPEGMVRKAAQPSSGTPVRNKAIPPKRAAERTRQDPQPTSPVALAAGPIPPAVAGLLASLPVNGNGWTKSERDRWVKIFGDVLDFSIPIRETVLAADTDDVDDDE